ncbi:TPA: DUF4062 domain-containing protein [Burkholderia territorii]|uniref:DUF4062 domain-containing protein n=1 Tax=Burkholderia territorii TaxID=1503055 RepID=UPI0011C7488C|nr:DUF4062 domain-containing protein [Burkholderia territorii]TXG20412.1 DUF4062 domain-containing protein [Burkholderia territorii]HDR8859344.1 DUF4062 domain-containing protein [Burkholderia territorii]HDR8866115.1 DUF4062 domain-containing protein [Burkholderia territorii]HDR8871853.1 DUF4062 domain-containing protein [Burkholderia territorii]HDR8877071.1 DUF4062 domain-containing protein [Burkholderia territorii]
MQKKYQVFVSSTFTDLKAERQHVMQALMEMDCIPAGMELFPAADEEQFSFIKRVIDDCDYYILIIGNRYGSIGDDGVSFTEKEFDYAISKGLRVVAFLHGEPNKISFEHSEQDPERRKKLEAFRAKVTEGRLVRFWTETNQLPGLVALSMNRTIMMFPAQGWVRAGMAASPDILLQLNELRSERDKLKAEAESLKLQINDEKNRQNDGLAGLDEKYSLTINFKEIGRATSQRSTVELSWRDIFGIISPFLETIPNDSRVNSTLGKGALVRRGYVHSNLHSTRVDEQQFRTVALQLQTLGLVVTKYTKATDGSYALFWMITEVGDRLMREIRLVRRSGNDATDEKSQDRG